MAQQALTTQAITGGRFILGIGLSHQPLIEGSFGYSFDKPIRHMREYLDVLLPLVREGSVQFAGETVTGAHRLDVRGSSPVRVLLAALGPQMLAARRCDGRRHGHVDERSVDARAARGADDHAPRPRTPAVRRR